jgi:NIMA (never in mitosis gene a)-related kinase 1/4/5
MCNQKRPFEAYSLNGLAVKVLEAHFAPVSEFYSRELRELINRMLQKKEKDRPSILEFLQTPIIKRRAAAYLKETYQRLTK